MRPRRSSGRAIQRALPGLLLLTAALRLRAAEPPTFVVNGPTIIAFAPLTQEEKDNASETLDDFRYYAGQVAGPFKRAGIAFQITVEPSFRVRCGGSVIAFRSKKGRIGYYFVAPGKKPRIEYGVNTGVGLFEIARDYFRITIE